MHEYWHIILEAIIDTAKILPFLFIVYYLIELLEYKCAHKWQRNKLLKGKFSPVIGSAIGCVPQCGFSVVSTDLFSKGKLSIGALIAVYIATSDEALPLMIANPKSVGWLLALIAVKLVLGIAVGYLAIALYKVIFNKPKFIKEHNHVHTDIHEEHIDANEHEEHIEEHTEHDNHDEAEETLHGGCCHHHVESKSFDWLHPMLHCLKISAFILIINVILNCVTHIWIGEDALINFLSASLWLQPLLAVIIGLIPNCAASVCITELFLMGGLSFGALVAGLCVNAGLGVVVLFQQNKNWRENLFVLLMLIIPSIVIGYALNFI